MSHQPERLPLGAALQLAGFADTGGQAKVMIQAGDVRVNGVVEKRRKRHLHAGDEIEVNGETFVLEVVTEASDDGS